MAGVDEPPVEPDERHVHRYGDHGAGHAVADRGDAGRGPPEPRRLHTLAVGDDHPGHHGRAGGQGGQHQRVRDGAAQVRGDRAVGDGLHRPGHELGDRQPEHHEQQRVQHAVASQPRTGRRRTGTTASPRPRAWW